MRLRICSLLGILTISCDFTMKFVPKFYMTNIVVPESNRTFREMIYERIIHVVRNMLTFH